MAKANTAVVVLERGRRTTAAQLRRDASLAVFSPPPVPAVLPALLVLRTVACPRACLQVVTPLIPKRRTCKGHSMILSCVPKGSPPSPSSPSPNAATPATISPHATTLFSAILAFLSIKYLLWQGSMRDVRKSGAMEISCTGQPDSVMSCGAGPRVPHPTSKQSHVKVTCFVC